MNDQAIRPLLDVVRVDPLPGFNLRLTFENGEIRRFNAAPFLSRAGGVFIPLRKMAVFRQAFVANGTVCWPNGADLDPEVLYEQSVLVESDGDEHKVTARVGVEKGAFERPDEPAHPCNREWEAMPDVGLEVWPS